MAKENIWSIIPSAVTFQLPFSPLPSDIIVPCSSQQLQSYSAAQGSCWHPLLFYYAAAGAEWWQRCRVEPGQVRFRKAEIRHSAFQGVVFARE